jgi:hypothetical protein
LEDFVVRWMLDDSLTCSILGYPTLIHRINTFASAFWTSRKPTIESAITFLLTNWSTWVGVRRFRHFVIGYPWQLESPKGQN